MNKQNLPDQRGAALVLVLVVAALVIAVGVLAYIHVQDAKKLSQSQKTTSMTQASPPPAATPNYFVIKEDGVKFVLPADLSDLYYTYSANITTGVRFSTKSVEAASGSTCTVNDGPIGYFYKGKAGQVDVGPDEPIEKAPNAKKIGDYYYDLELPQAVCSNKAAFTTLQQQQFKSLSNAISTSLQAD